MPGRALGLRQTLQALDAAGIEAFGAGENSDRAARPLLREKPVGRARFWDELRG